jgi:hypothetical protein
LELWRRGKIHELALRSKIAAGQRLSSKRSKAARAARRAAHLARKNQFTWAASLVGSMGVADATTNTLAAFRTLFPEPEGTSDANLHDLYCPATFPSADDMLIQVTLDNLKSCIATAPSLLVAAPFSFKQLHFMKANCVMHKHLNMFYRNGKFVTLHQKAQKMPLGFNI